ncbi:MAG: hypothetical protein RBU27_00525 [Bacteroidota bacterium]|jgi:hypothetical protein|nr:hypothetical protein [Bacteroidota bacterium]
MRAIISIPFTLPDVYQGLAEGHGRLSADEQGLMLEYRIEDALVGVVKSAVREIRIAYDDIDDIAFIDRWYRRRVVIQLHHMRAIADFPAAKSGRIILKISRAARERARELFSYSSLRISEARLRQFEAPDDWPV